MVETLTNINKSGKVKTGAEGEQGNEAAARMKKYLSSLGRKKHRGLLIAHGYQKAQADAEQCWPRNPCVYRSPIC